jgi:hypothetical protein
MNRLPVRLPDFTRLAWVSDEAQAVWQPRLQRIGTAWQEVEWRAVAAGIRRAAQRVLSPALMPGLVAEMAQHGLLSFDVARVGVSGAPYRATAVVPRSGEPFLLRVLITSPQDREAVTAAWQSGQQLLCSSFLGAPDCCARSFARIWEQERYLDATWPMVAELAGERSEIEIEAAPEANLLLRWLGVRPVPHLPCRFDCPATIALGRQLLAVMRQAGYGLEADWQQEMLRWPMEWSALHGIAEIKTPIVRIMTCTDATAKTYRVRLLGAVQPQETGQGLGFPFRRPTRLRVLQSTSYQRGLENPIQPGLPSP